MLATTVVKCRLRATNHTDICRFTFVLTLQIADLTVKGRACRQLARFKNNVFLTTSGQ